MRNKICAIVVSGVVSALLCLSALSADEPVVEPTPSPIPPPPLTQEKDGPSSNAAIDFLERLEAKNKDVKTLTGSFHQVRENPMFLEQISSDGRFWYTKPSQFRCDYDQPNETRFYLLDREIITYTPRIKQVEKVVIEDDGSQPINQMLVGFGVETDKILEVFAVSMAADQPEEPGRLAIRFDSRDVERTLGYSLIEVIFDEAALEPRELHLEDGDGIVTLTLDKITVDAPIPADTYALIFPADVETIEY